MTKQPPLLGSSGQTRRHFYHDRTSVMLLVEFGLTARKLLRRAPGRRGDTALTLLRMMVGLFVAAATPVLAHSGAAAPDLAGAGHGLAAGFVHPFSGADHVLAMA